ncbi:MAG: peptidoglycan-binding protein [Microbacterium sp.]|uniref:peptidoglycan-binding domain-containing protein n=1 Tax=Microbacterium sp. TaxID=51671 RepID=UPI0019C463AE|nr:peptidoglycan-binding domain-containing protein [Microbacterium sp.]MBD3756784.1 peptidoglycan-binding protein [Microbacterium sp.]
MVELCFAASEAVSEIAPLSDIGNLVEIFVDIEYIRFRNNQGGRVDLYPSPTANDFFDIAGDRCGQFAGFIKMKRPSVDETLIEDWCRQRKARDGDKSMVPDIITNEGAWREYYELKPASTSSIGKGRQKLRNFAEIDAGFQLQYVAGSRWSPSIRQLVWNGTWLGSPAKCYLVVELLEPGLITYKFCVEVTAESVNEWAIKTMFKMVIVAAILSRNPIFVGAAAAILLAPRLRSPLVSQVGWGRPNREPDVRYVQRLLNAWLGPGGQALLSTDGRFGDLTAGAIVAFQRDYAGFVNPDGWIAPGKQTIAALESQEMGTWAPGVSDHFLTPEELALLAPPEEIATMMARSGNEEPEPYSVDPEVQNDPLEVLTTLTQGYLDSLHA